MNIVDALSPAALEPIFVGIGGLLILYGIIRLISRPTLNVVLAMPISYCLLVGGALSIQSVTPFLLHVIQSNPILHPLEPALVLVSSIMNPGEINSAHILLGTALIILAYNTSRINKITKTSIGKSN